MGKLTMNSVDYFVKGPLHWAKSSRYPPAIRTTGEESRTLKQPYPSTALGEPGLTGGMGREYWLPTNNEYHFGTAHTVWPGIITLPLRRMTATETDFTNAIQMLGYSMFDGTLYGFCKDDGDLKCGTFDGTTWTYKSSADTGITTFYDCEVMAAPGQRDYYLVVTYTKSSSVWYAYSSNGTSWTTVNISTMTGVSCNGPSSLAVVPSQSATVLMNLLAFVNNTAGKLQVWHSDNVTSGSWAARLEVGYWDNGTYLPTDAFLDGSAYGPFLATQSKVFGTSDGFEKQVLHAPGLHNATFGRSMTRWGAYLAVPTIAGGMLLYESDGTITEYGIDIGEGFPQAYRGDITALFADRYFLFTAVKGASFSGVYYFDGAGYHPLWVGSSSTDIPAITAAATGGVPAVHFSPAAGSNIYIPNYHINPLELPTASLQTHGYEESGWIDYPKFGAATPEVQSLFASLTAHASSLSANEKLVLTCGYDDEAATTNALGTIDSTTRELVLNTTGKKAYTMQVRVTLHRATGAGNSHLTPVLHYPVISGTRTNTYARLLAMSIDIDRTAAASNRSPARVVDDINTLVNSGTLVPVSYNPGTGTAVSFNADIQKAVFGEAEDGSYIVELQLHEV